MMAIEPAVELFLRQTLVAVISTVDQNRRPRSAPIWYHWEDGAAHMFTARDTLKWRNIQHDPYASLCVDWREPPYQSVILDGPIQETQRPLYELVLGMAVRYFGKGKGTEFAEGYKDRSQDVATFHLVPDRIANYLKE